jgi:hypothetical protein
VRNVAEGAVLARRAATLLGEEHPNVLDTLAAVYASDGQFEQAVDTARRAAARARATSDHSTRVDDIERRIRLYQAREVYRLQEP